MGLKFTWDKRKNRINIKKHGISFDVAQYVFYDDHRLELFDSKHSQYEDRYVVIGMVEELLYVVYTERGDITRLISARLATEREARYYYDAYFYT